MDQQALQTTSNPGAVQLYKTREDALQIVDAFIAQQPGKDSTRYTYRRSLNQFIAWVYDTGRNLDKLTKADVVAYLAYLLPDEVDAAHKSALTASSYFTAVKLFYKWAADNLAYPNIAAGVPLPRRAKVFRKEALTPEEAHALLDEVEATATTRDTAIVNLLLRNGLRTIEVTRANVEDLQTKAGRTILYVQGKGHNEKDTPVVISPKCKAALTAYLDTRPTAKGHEPLFTCTSHNNQDGRLTTRTISGLVKQHLRAIGIDDRAYTAHSLRHTCACSLLDATGDLEAVRGVLRHSSVNTTRIYTYHIEERRRLAEAPELCLDNVF